MGMRLQIMYRGYGGTGQQQYELEFRQLGDPGGAVSLPASNPASNCYDIPDLVGVVPGRQTIGVDVNAMPIVTPRGPLLLRIGELCGGDWSGRGPFDGRDVNRWIITAINGTAEQLVKLHEELGAVERAYDS